MIVLAIVPAVWRQVMDPRVLAHFDGDLSRASLSPRKRDKILAKYPPPAATTVEVPATGAPVVPAALDVLAARCPGCGYTYRVEEGNELEGSRPAPPGPTCPTTGAARTAGCGKVDFVPLTEAAA